MLASLTRHPFDSPDYLYELKWDGIRALATVQGGSATLTDRNGREITHVFPELAQIGVQAKDGGTVLDGEIVCLDKEGRPSFSLLQERLAHPNARSRNAQANYIVFDVLYVNGMSVMKEPLHRRKARLHQLLPSSELVQPCAYIEREGKAFFHATCQLGLEGIVAKEKSSLYSPGKRSSAWQKGEALEGVRVHHRRIRIRRTEGRAVRVATLGFVQRAGRTGVRWQRWSRLQQAPSQGGLQIAHP